MARPAAASSRESVCARRRGISTPNPCRKAPRLRQRRKGDGKWSRTWLSPIFCFARSPVAKPGPTFAGCALTVKCVPDAARRRGHFEFVVADRIRDRVDHGGGGADRAGLAAALDAERIARTERWRMRQLER